MKHRIEISVGRLLWVSLMSAILGGDFVVMLDQMQSGRSVIVPLVMIPLVAVGLIYVAISRPSNERMGSNTR